MDNITNAKNQISELQKAISSDPQISEWKQQIASGTAGTNTQKNLDYKMKSLQTDLSVWQDKLKTYEEHAIANSPEAAALLKSNPTAYMQKYGTAQDVANQQAGVNPTGLITQPTGTIVAGQNGLGPQIPKNELASKFKGGLAQATTQSKNAPSSYGEALGTIQQTTANAPQQANVDMVDAMLAEDKGFLAIKDAYSKYFDPNQQKTTLLDTYNQMSKTLGLEALDKEILDAKTILEGTEDDIRNEIQMAGGFGTDSQVQALSLARNKTLLKNYNNLVAMRESKQNSLTTMMNLAEKDRAYADQQMERMFNFELQMQDYRQKFIQNTLDQYNKYPPAQLYEMLKNNPRQLAFAEQIMGVGSGGLKALAEMPVPMTEKERLENELLRARIGTERAQAGKIYSDMKTASQVAKGQPSPYQAERAFRTIQSVNELSLLAQKSPSIFGRSAAVPLPGFLRSDEYRNFKAELDTLKSNIAFGELQAMREASKTGGALGSVANQELQLLESTLGALNMSQSAENFQRNLYKIRASIQRWQSAQGGSSNLQQNIITAPTGEQIIIVD